jgi:hypothetical protein
MSFCPARYIRCGNAASAADAAQKCLREAYAAAASGDDRRADEKAREAARFLTQAVDALLPETETPGEVVRLHRMGG